MMKINKEKISELKNVFKNFEKANEEVGFAISDTQDYIEWAEQCNQTANVLQSKYNTVSEILKTLIKKAEKVRTKEKFIQLKEEYISIIRPMIEDLSNTVGYLDADYSVIFRDRDKYCMPELYEFDNMRSQLDKIFGIEDNAEGNSKEAIAS